VLEEQPGNFPRLSSAGSLRRFSEERGEMADGAIHLLKPI
jgi:hypothetical protein